MDPGGSVCDGCVLLHSAKSEAGGESGVAVAGTPDPKGSSSTGSERGESAVRGHLRLTRLSDVGSRANRWRGSPAPDQ